MGMLTGKEILLLDLYSFQRWPDVRAAFDRSGWYTPSWSAARAKSIAEDGDSDWWDDISPAYEWMMGEVNDRNDEHCGLSLSGSASERLQPFSYL